MLTRVLDGESAGEGSINSLVELNKISNAKIGIMIDATYYGFTDFTVYKNICNNVFIGMDIFNSNSKIIKNFIYTDIDNSALLHSILVHLITLTNPLSILI